MHSSIKQFLFAGLWCAIILFVVRCAIAKPTGLYESFGYAGEAISVSVILMGFYERILWRFNPFAKTPKINGYYSATIEYKNGEKFKKKNVNVKIKQSLLAVNVKIITNEITSNSITSYLEETNGEYILYYTYITNPQIKYSQENPIQYGTCRIIINNEDELNGIYWTSRQRTGDIKLKRSSVK